MGCFICGRFCIEKGTSIHGRSRSKSSFDSIDTKATENHYESLLQKSREGLLNIEESRLPKRMRFDQDRFTSSLAVFFNNTKQGRRVNVYTKAMQDSPDIYFQHFPYIRLVESSGGYILDRVKSPTNLDSHEAISNVAKTRTFLRHLEMTNRLINNILNIAVNENLESVSVTLRRLGTKHAELGIPAQYLYAFRESFMAYLGDVLDHDKEIFKIWDTLIKHVVSLIVQGMNEHYKKIIFVYSRFHPGNACCPAYAPKPTGLNPDAMLSLRNVAASIEDSYE